MPDDLLHWGQGSDYEYVLAAIYCPFRITKKDKPSNIGNFYFPKSVTGRSTGLLLNLGEKGLILHSPNSS